MTSPLPDVEHWLIDKSALAHLADSAGEKSWAARIDRGLVRVTTETLLEVDYSARSASDLRELLDEPSISSMPVECLTPLVEDRAVQVLRILAERGHHRAPSIADLFVAAAAELRGLTVLHLDKDFELIVEVTGQRQERLIVRS